MTSKTIPSKTIVTTKYESGRMIARNLDLMFLKIQTKLYFYNKINIQNSLIEINVN